MKTLLASLTAVGMIGAASAATNLVTNGDFSDPAGSNWGQAAVGVTWSFPATGGNTGGYAQADQGAGGWGGVLINDNDSPASLASLGLTAGTSYEFTIDMVNLGPGTPVAGMKMENWNAGLINDSGDVTFALTNSWDTYTFNFTVDAGATALKFVPLLVSQPAGSSVGFDNVGVNVVTIPEPTSSLLLGLGAMGLLIRRRR